MCIFQLKQLTLALIGNALLVVTLLVHMFTYLTVHSKSERG